MNDHFDGVRYFNPGTPPPPPGRTWRIIRWAWFQKRPRWPALPPDPPAPPPPAGLAPGSVAATFIGHATFLLRFAGATVLTDPVFSDRASPVRWAGPRRARPPSLALAALPRIDLVLLSHCHYDHLDLPTLRALRQRDAPRVVTLPGNARHVRKAGLRADELDWWEAASVAGLHLTATPARHASARTPFDGNRALWGGFMIQAPGVRVLFAGDSAAGPHWQAIGARLGPPDLALLPIGAYEPRSLMRRVHMDPAEAVQAHQALGARRSLGMHFGTFQLTDEPIEAPAQDLQAAADAAGLPAGAFTAPGFGETLLLPGQHG